MISTTGAAARAARYQTELVARLRRDPRVLEVYATCTTFFRPDRHSPQEAGALVLTLIRTLVLDELRLSAYPWIVELMRYDFLAWLAEGTVVVDPPVVPDLPKTREPKGGGDSLVQDIDWFYRNQVLGETKYQIAKTDLEKGGENDSTVQAALVRTKKLFASLCVDD